MDEPPQPFIYALALSESDSLLWVAASVADEGWRKADLNGGDDDNYYDDILEVINLRTNRVIASQRFDHSYHLVEAGVLGRVAITSSGSVKYQTFRARLEAATARGPGADRGSLRDGVRGARRTASAKAGRETGGHGQKGHPYFPSSGDMICR